MQSLRLVDGPIPIAGAVSLRVTDDGVQPRRSPHDRFDLLEPSLHCRAARLAGVRLTTVSDGPALEIDAHFMPQDDPPGEFHYPQWTIDLLVDGMRHRRITQPLACETFVFDGQCHFDAMAARVIRELDLDYISLCFGINVYGDGSITERVFRGAVIGVIKTIRDRCPTTPIAVVSPLYATPRENASNASGLTLLRMRAAASRRCAPDVPGRRRDLRPRAAAPHAGGPRPPRRRRPSGRTCDGRQAREAAGRAAVGEQ